MTQGDGLRLKIDLASLRGWKWGWGWVVKVVEESDIVESGKKPLPSVLLAAVS